MASKVDIWNLSRTMLEQEVILEPNDNEAVIENAIWNTVRDAVLAMHPWTCALKKKTLGRLAQSPDFGYQYAYSIPADLLRVVRMEPRMEGEEEPAWSRQGNEIHTDEEEVKITYIFRQEDTTRYSPLLVFALASYLAYMTAGKLTGKSSLRAEMLSVFNAHLQEAKNLNNLESSSNREKAVNTSASARSSYTKARW